MMTEDRSVPGDGLDDIVEDLRRCNPVDIEALPSSRSTEAMAALERILDSGDEPIPPSPNPSPTNPNPSPTSPNPSPTESSLSPAAGDPAGEKGRRRVQRRGDS